MTPTLVCFGEILWDVLPSSKQAGGAPMNVAVHLRNFGLNAQLISRVGSDELGQELLQFLAEKEVPTEYVQVGQSHLTGVAKANISDANEVTYKIVQPVAWDYIQLDDALLDLVRNAEVFVFGSLAARSPRTSETLNRLLDVAQTKVFDVNLRPPHFSRQGLESLLRRADLVKMNEHELALIAGWYKLGNAGLNEQMRALYDRFEPQTLIVSQGGTGAYCYENGELFFQPSLKIRVNDTIGSGDAFLAGFLTRRLQGGSPQESLALACKAGAFVATQAGATPKITPELLQDEPAWTEAV